MLDWLMLHFAKNIAWKQKNPAYSVTYPVTQIPYSRSSNIDIVFKQTVTESNVQIWAAKDVPSGVVLKQHLHRQP